MIFVILDGSNELHRVARKTQGKPPQNNDATKKQRKQKNKQANAQEEPSTRILQKMQEQVRSRLICCGAGQELEVLHHALKPDNHMLWLKCMEVKRDLLMAFQSYYPFVRLEVFGSTVMGIAFKGNLSSFFSSENINHKIETFCQINGHFVIVDFWPVQQLFNQIIGRYFDY